MGAAAAAAAATAATAAVVRLLHSWVPPLLPLPLLLLLPLLPLPALAPRVWCKVASITLHKLTSLLLHLHLSPCRLQWATCLPLATAPACQSLSTQQWLPLQTATRVVAVMKQRST